MKETVNIIWKSKKRFFCYHDQITQCLYNYATTYLNKWKQREIQSFFSLQRIATFISPVHFVICLLNTS